MYKDLQVGDKVVYTNKKDHKEYPNWYPPVGTIGVVVKTYDRSGNLRVQWPKDKTAGSGIWFVSYGDVKKYKDPILTRICDFLFHRGKKNA